MLFFSQATACNGMYIFQLRSKKLSNKDKAAQRAFYNAIIYFNMHHHSLNRESQHIRAWDLEQDPATLAAPAGFF